MSGLPDGYGALSRELLRRAGDIGQPASGTFELTHRCNLGCRMCYVRQPAGDAGHRQRELSAAQWGDLAREAVDQGLVFLLLTGGEVLLRPDFFAIWEPLTRLGLVLSVFTNGTLVTDAVADRLAAAPPARIEITLYGATPDTADAVTGCAGGFARCVAGIERLLARGVPLAIKATLTRQNVGELPAMQALARDWGVAFTGSWLLAPRPDAAASDLAACRLPAAECVAIEAGDPTGRSDWQEVAARAALATEGGNFTCDAGRASFVISPAGEMNVCPFLARPQARPREVGFAAAWAQVRDFVAAAPPPAAACLACGARRYCGRCPGWSQLETGTLTEPVPYLCEMARLRRQRYGESTGEQPPS